MLDVVIVGAGPASIGLLSSLLRKNKTYIGKTPKICVIDRSSLKGFGSLADYNIPSDTRAEKFLTCLDDLPTSITGTPKLKASIKVLQSYGTNAAPLPVVAEFYRLLGQNIFKNMVSRNQLDLRPKTNVLSAEWHNDHWQLMTSVEGIENILQTKNLVLACGAIEPQDRFDSFLSSIGLSTKDLKSWCLSSDILKVSDVSACVSDLGLG